MPDKLLPANQVVELRDVAVYLFGATAGLLGIIITWMFNTTRKDISELFKMCHENKENRIKNEVIVESLKEQHDRNHK